MTKRSALIYIAGLACAFGALSQAQAQQPDYPNKPIRMIVGVAAGGGADFIARILAQEVGKSLGQPIVVENRPGAGGNIAAEFVARSPADGYTLLMANSSHAINVNLYHNLRFDALKDFAPISQVTANYFFLAVNPAVPVKSVAELVGYAKSKNGAMSYASAGNGQGAHLGMELFKKVAHMDAVHVPYNGTAPSLAAVLGHTVDVALLTPPATLPNAAAKKLRVIAVTGPRRSASLPDVPTIAESGYPGFEVNNWQGLLAPAGTPADIIAKLNQATVKALKQPAVVKQLETAGTEPVGSSPEEFKRFLAAEVSKWGKVIEQSGAKAD
ncbi:Bug family tripartite tricarboxylate transporter substrate binding protein [Cupriavidus sp. 2TAF22]|uniref:Bug family tripartite tricarboxylate transporter substrate binding protein n=1 Tax=unclassified Cupriavidus TaxID=2640874 RepID=UPI003F938C14